MTKDFWIFQPNLISALLIFSYLVNYDLNEDELSESVYGITETSFQKNIWWNAQLSGEKSIDLSFARDEENSDIIFVKASFDQDLMGKIDVAIFILEEFDVRDSHFRK